jgi:hypothetical protein
MYDLKSIMKVNILLVVMLVILAKVSFSKTLVKLNTNQNRVYVRISQGWEFLKASEDFEDGVISTQNIDTPHIKWLFTKNSDNTYFITSLRSKRALTVQNGGLFLIPLNSLESQKFVLEGGSLKSKSTGTCLRMSATSYQVGLGACDKNSKIKLFDSPN